MLNLRSVFSLLCFVLLSSSAAVVDGQPPRTTPRKWQTLNGDPTLVIARGGFPGLFPDSSNLSYSTAQLTSPDCIFWCDVQLTSDGDGICSPSINLQNLSIIEYDFPNRSRTYLVDGVSTTGWFSLDFTSSELHSVKLRQGVYTRTQRFDDSSQYFLNVEEVFNVQYEPRPGMWLSVPHDQFFSQRRLSMLRYIQFISSNRSVVIGYISSPEVGFLRSVASLRGTKRVFQVLDREAVEPTMNATYGSILGNLTFIRTFADGILVPKTYIWPIDNRQYLQNYTSLVLDAHSAGLEVFATGFASDEIVAYDYRFDPVSEYLSFIDNGQFSVDGLVSDFPVSLSETIDCYAHMGQNATALANITIFTNEGASGVYPGCTDVAYRQAVSDGADIIDCPVQMTSDGIPFCLGSINLRDRTSVTTSIYSSRTTTNPALNITDGIFAYNLTWSEIQSLSPAMYNPYAANYSLFRNPRASNDGNFTRLSDFLVYANQSSISGVLISVENAAYLASDQGLDVISAVLNALGEAGYNHTSTKRVLIKSSDSSVLKSIRSRSIYELVYEVGEDISEISSPIITEIKKFANSVTISKNSVYPNNKAFLTGETDVVSELQGSNLSVYVQYFRNEFVSQPWDFLADPSLELNTYVLGEAIDGVVTDYPATAARFRRNRCLGYPAKEQLFYAAPIQPGSLLMFMSPASIPPAEAPKPVLIESDVVEPPLPPVAVRPPPAAAPGPAPRSGQTTLVASTFLSVVAVLVVVGIFGV